MFNFPLIYSFAHWLLRSVFKFTSICGFPSYLITSDFYLILFYSKQILCPISVFWGLFLFPGDSDGKAFDCNAWDQASIPGSGRSHGEGNGNPLPVLLPGKFHGRRSLVGYSPWGHKELDMTEQFHFLFMSQYTVYLGECTKCTLKECVFCSCQV